MILERLLFCSGQQPLISAQGLAFLSQAEDNLSPWAVGPPLVSTEGVRPTDTETKPRGVGWREIQLQEFSAPQPLTKPWVVGLFGVCDANVWRGPRGLLPLDLPELGRVHAPGRPAGGARDPQPL